MMGSYWLTMNPCSSVQIAVSLGTVFGSKSLFEKQKFFSISFTGGAHQLLNTKCCLWAFICYLKKFEGTLSPRKVSVRWCGCLCWSKWAWSSWCYFVATQKNQNRFSWQVSCVSGSQWVFFLFNYSKSCDFGISAHLIFVLRGVICGTEDCHLEFYDLFLALELCMWTNSFPQTTAEDRQQLSWLTTPSLHCLFRPPSFTSICLTIFLFPVIAFFLAFHFCTHSSGSNAARIHQPCINSD